MLGGVRPKARGDPKRIIPNPGPQPRCLSMRVEVREQLDVEAAHGQKEKPPIASQLRGAHGIALVCDG